MPFLSRLMVVVVTALMMCWQAPAEAAARRVALIIGNSNYSSLSRLRNPVTDARAVAAELIKNGFEVYQHYNLNRADLLDALEIFQEAAQKADLALVYYAGHGMEIGGKNIIAPTDTEVTCQPKKARRAVKVARLFEAASGARNRIIMLDSCRNNPFPRCPTRATRAGSGFRGLSRIGGGLASTLIVNATLSGALAADGDPGQHSPFARALLKRFSSNANVYFRDLFDQVAQDVSNATQGQQVPEVISRGGSPSLCLSPSDCTKLAALPGGVVKQTPTVQPKVVPQPQEYSPGATFKDCEDCPQMVVVPAGAFTMGADPGEAGFKRAEGPAHTVIIAKAFAVSKFEITFDQWQTCVLEGGCRGYRPKDAGWGKGKRPVIYVSWEDAKAYVNWLRGVTGKRYRLLSEAEWEYAARGGTTGAYATGARITTAEANIDGTNAVAGQRGQYRGKSVEVGSFSANPFGLHDMHGNVAEWVEDCWNRSHAGAPADGSPRAGDCSRRVVKGGAWYFEPTFARIAARMSFPMTKRLNIIGFRVARPLE